MDLSHVISIDIIRRVADTEIHEIALYNKNRISDEEVREFLTNSTMNEYSPEILVMSIDQFNHIFRDKEN